MIAGALVGLAGRLLGNLFGSREKRHREAAQRVANQLHEHLDDVEKTIRDTFNHWYSGAVDRDAIQPAANEIRSLTQAAGLATNVVMTLAAQQKASLSELNRDLIGHALAHIGHESEEPKITGTARLPGQATVLRLQDSQILSNEAMESLEQVLAESVNCIAEGKPARELIAELCGTSGEEVYIDGENSTAEVANLQGDPNARVQAGLAHQLTGLRISNSGNSARTMQ